MLSNVLRAAARPAARSLRPAGTGASILAARTLATSAIRRSGHAAAPSIFGTGGKAGEIPTDEEQETGLARLQLLGDLEGTPVFDYAPLDASRVGTLKNPVKVYSLDVMRIVGCTGVPADSHDVVWFQVAKEKTRRCPECGSAYALDYHGAEHHDAHHH